MIDNEILSVTQAMKVLKICRTTLYNLLESGELKSFKIGKKKFTTRKFIDEFIEQKSKI